MLIKNVIYGGNGNGDTQMTEKNNNKVTTKKKLYLDGKEKVSYITQKIFS